VPLIWRALVEELLCRAGFTRIIVAMTLKYDDFPGT